MGKWLTLAALGAVLAAALWVSFREWLVVTVELSPLEWLMLVLGVIVSLAVGIGLMTLIFYSSRRGYDEPPQSLDQGDKHQ